MFPKIGAELGMLQPVMHGRLEVAQLAAAVEAPALELEAIDRLLEQQPGDGVSELDLAARPGPVCSSSSKIRGVRM
jgi:hypothetical protein